MEARVDLRRTRLSLTSWRFPSFDVHAGSSAGSRWKKWLATSERLFTGMNVKIPKRKRALLLHYADPDVDEIFDTLPNTGRDNDYDTAVAKLNEYFTPQVNSTYEVYNFRQTKQKEGESLDSYHTRLRQLAKTCEFTNVNKEIKAACVQTSPISFHPKPASRPSGAIWRRGGKRKESLQIHLWHLNISSKISMQNADWRIGNNVISLHAKRTKQTPNATYKTTNLKFSELKLPTPKPSKQNRY